MINIFRIIFVISFSCDLYRCRLLQEGPRVGARPKRDADASTSLPPDVPIISLQLNASIMACNHAVVLPAMRIVNLSDSQMRQLMENKGGNYLHDYMAATQEEAIENFSNMLLVTDPSQGIYVTEPMSMYENYIAKSVLMEDLNRLKFYLMNTSNSNNGHPEMGMYVVNNTDTGSATPMDNLTDNDGNSFGPSSSKEHVTVTEKTTTANKPSLNGVYLDQSRTANTKSATGSKVTSTTMPTDITESHASLKTSRNQVTTEPFSNQLTISSLITGASSTKRDSLPTRYGFVSTTTSKPSAFTPGGLDSLTSRGVTEDPMVSLSSSTMDPDVQKSLAELNKYLQGTNGLIQSDLVQVLRDIKTTVDPDHLVRLAGTFHSRRKRNADGSTTQEQFCQLKGSLMDDRQYVHICSSCAATTKLPLDFFPRYINEAVCKSGDTDCFKIGNTVHGRCRQRFFTLNMLRKSNRQCMVMNHNGENLVLDDWQLVPKQIRVACECTINKLSFLKTYVSEDSVPVG